MQFSSQSLFAPPNYDKWTNWPSKPWFCDKVDDASSYFCGDQPQLSLLTEEIWAFNINTDRDASFSCSPFSSNSYGSSNRSDIETIDDKSFYDNFARFLLKDKRYTSPPGNYICHICYHHGHYIQNCPKKAAHETQTPYQGVKACFGFYKCPKCMRKWTSTKSYAELKQECKKCKVSDYPYKQLRLDVAEGRGLYKKFEK